MRTMMPATRFAAMLMFSVGFQTAMVHAATTPDPLPPGVGKYVMVLWPAGAPIAGDPTGTVRNLPEPDIVSLGRTLLSKNDNRRLITLPLSAAAELRRNEAVSYLQRLWNGEPLQGWNETYSSASGPRLRPRAESDTDLTWGPKDYQYDGSGNIKQIGTDHYTYDSAGRLIQGTVDGKTETYQYDSFGNLIQKGVSGANPTLISVDGSSNRMLDQSYDAAGNVTSGKGGARTYSYDSANMLSRAVQNDLNHAARRMIYDADDEQIATMVVGDSQSRWTFRDFEGRVIREYKASLLQYWLWEEDEFYGDGILLGGETQEWGTPYQYGGPRHYHLDHLGNVRVVTDNSHRSLSEHEYYPFGTTMTRTYQEQLNWADPHIDAMRFAGHWRDFLGVLNVDNTDYLDYMHARYYDPNLGRFLSVDPNFDDDTPLHPQKWNRYSYVQNNPLRYADPDGRSAWDAVNGYFNALFSDYLPIIVRRVNDPTTDYKIGQLNGDRAAVATGGILATTGTIGGIITSPSGVGALAGGGVAVLGTVGGLNGAIHLAQDENPKSGGGNSDKPREFKDRVPGQSGKEAARNAPSWAEGQRPYKGESGKDFATRLLNDKYGEGNWKRGAGSEFNKLQKYADRGFQ